jgi:hypothetical protein
MKSLTETKVLTFLFLFSRSIGYLLFANDNWALYQCEKNDIIKIIKIKHEVYT